MVRDGLDVTLAATGGILGEALQAADQLAGHGIFCRVLSVHTVKPIDSDTLVAAAAETGGIISIEEHAVDGGLGGAIAEALMEAGVLPRFFVRMGLRNTFSSVVGSQQYLRRVLFFGCRSHRSNRIRPPGNYCRRSRMILKRAFDIVAASGGLLLFSPLLMAVMLVIWMQDGRSPFYIALRAARGGGTFRMVKFRSMVVNADKIGGSSTSLTDPRITRVGRLIRAYKLDELIQLWNVLKGEMSLVGPRPQVVYDAGLYTDEEKRMLTLFPASPTRHRSSSPMREKSWRAARIPAFYTTRSFVPGRAAWRCSISKTAISPWMSG